MAWEYAGLFDAIPTEGDLLSTFWQTSATDIKVGSMGYRTATVKAGGRLEAEIYPIYGRRMEAAARKAKQKGNTPEAQKKLNAENAKRKLILILEENFKYFEDDTLTLTYQNEPADLKRCQMDIRFSQAPGARREWLQGGEGSPPYAREERKRNGAGLHGNRSMG